MRSEIVPLCDKHKTPMTFSEYRADSFQMRAFGCSHAGCARVYNSSSGYLDVVEGRILLRLCPKDGTAMFLEFVAQKGIEHWRCGQINCDAAFAVQP